jgi:anti-sigma regulatory factor (Ser/Thr protein kinase)
MSQGHHRARVRTGSGPCVQEPLHSSLPEDAWLGAVPPPTPGACQIASCPLDPGATASGAARDFTRQILGSWGLLVLAEDAAVIVSELVTNALCHGVRDANGPVHGRVELILLHRAGEMVCAVTDPGAGHPVLGAPDPAAEAGRGLNVIEALAATWGWTRLDAHKKAVWATLSIPAMDGAEGHFGLPALSRGHAMRSAGRCVAAPAPPGSPLALDSIATSPNHPGETVEHSRSAQGCGGRSGQ